MFERLKISEYIRNLAGKGKIKEKDLKEVLQQVKESLIDADVAIAVVKQFIMHVREKALGQQITKSLTPSQELLKLVKQELTLLMGNKNEELNLRAAPPVVILLVGLQGAGKTTTAAKLAKFLKERHKKKVMLASTDVYRPAAMEQLNVLAQEINVDSFPGNPQDKPVKIAQQALREAKAQNCDVLIVDSAGRMHIDATMMQEVQELSKTVLPTETLFVVDSMTGQDAVNTTKEFNAHLKLTGVILTKIDGDARGGAALSIRKVAAVPIKFLGTGEKSQALEPFYPERLASRILGMGDVLSLLDEAEQQIDKEQAQQATKKLRSGEFNYNDFQKQLQQINSMGGISNIIDKLPGLGHIPKDKLGVDQKKMQGIDAMIKSMTKEERLNPDLINVSRKKRIARGSGRDIHEINRYIKEFGFMRKNAKKLLKGGMGKMMGMLDQFR